MKSIKGDLLNFPQKGHLDRSQMLKIGFKPYMTIIYCHSRGDIECILTGADFDEELLYLALPDNSAFRSQWPDGTFPARIENCKLPTKRGKMKVK